MWLFSYSPSRRASWATILFVSLVMVAINVAAWAGIAFVLAWAAHKGWVAA